MCCSWLYKLKEYSLKNIKTKFSFHNWAIMIKIVQINVFKKFLIFIYTHTLKRNQLDCYFHDSFYFLLWCSENSTVRNLWIKIIRREDWKPEKYSHVCSEHFTTEDYIKRKTKPSLKKDVISSLFSAVPRYLHQTSQKKRKTLDSNEMIPPQKG